MGIHRSAVSPCRRSGHALVFTVIGLVFLSSCSGFTISEDARIPLVTGTPHSGRQTEFDYVIEYRYEFRPGGARQPGRLDLRFSLQRTSRVDSLTVFINYLDWEGRILGKNTIYNQGNRSRTVQISEGPFETPPGTAAIAFASVSREAKSNR